MPVCQCFTKFPAGCLGSDNSPHYTVTTSACDTSSRKLGLRKAETSHGFLRPGESWRGTDHLSKDDQGPAERSRTNQQDETGLRNTNKSGPRNYIDNATHMMLTNFNPSSKPYLNAVPDALFGCSLLKSNLHFITRLMHLLLHLPSFCCGNDRYTSPYSCYGTD